MERVGHKSGALTCLSSVKVFLRWISFTGKRPATGNIEILIRVDLPEESSLFPLNLETTYFQVLLINS